jgi:TonB family protein
VSSLFLFFLALYVFAVSRPALWAQETRIPMTLPAPILLSPADGVELRGYPRLLNFQWSEVQGASSYAIEIDCLGCCVQQAWCTNRGKSGYTIRDLEVPGFSFAFWGDLPGRWRVWAQGPGGDGNVSEWREFSFNDRGTAPSASPAGSRATANRDCSWRSSQPWEPVTTSPYLAYSSMPQYSGSSDKERVNAVVALEVRVASDGHVENVCELNSADSDLTEAAVRAVKTWRFAPATKQGVAVPSTAHLEIRFRACCDQAVLFYPAPPKTTVAPAAVWSNTAANTPCRFWPAPEPGTTLAKAVYNPQPPYSDAARENPTERRCAFVHQGRR